MLVITGMAKFVTVVTAMFLLFRAATSDRTQLGRRVIASNYRKFRIRVYRRPIEFSVIDINLNSTRAYNPEKKNHTFSCSFVPVSHSKKYNRINKYINK